MASTIIKWVRKLPTTRLGRWQTQKTLDSTKRTIDFANTDHCGTCLWTEKRYYFAGHKSYDGNMKINKEVEDWQEYLKRKKEQTNVLASLTKKEDDDDDDDELHNNFYYVPYCL